MRIAVVGAGISGLTAAYVLQREHDVTVFEKASHVGGHTLTLDVRRNGRDSRVDTGFVVFNTTTYPNFVRLLDARGVRSQPSSMSFSVRCDASGLEYRGHFPRSFQRMWEFYFAYCEAGFRERMIGDLQLLLAHPHVRVPALVPQV